MKLPVHCHAFNAAAKLAGLGRDCACLVRPDGHIALAMQLQQSGALQALALRLGLDLSASTQPRTAPSRSEPA